MKCRLCNGNCNFFSKATLCKKFSIDYFICNNCGFLQTEKPYWLSDIYKDPINISDTGILKRNISLSKKTAVLLFTLFHPEVKCLDYAGGYGVFCRLMRDLGYNFFWYDPYTPNIFARGFEHDLEIPVDFLTSFESLEHFEYPLVEFEKFVKLAPNILLSTLLYPEPPPSPNSWWYYGLDHGQHIGFYSKKTLRYIANYFGLNVFTDGNHLHLFCKEKLKIKKGNLFLMIRYGILGENKIEKLLDKSEALFPYFFRYFPENKMVEDSLNLTSDYGKQ